MPNPAIKFYLQGAGAEQAAQDLARFLGQEYDTTPAVHNNASSADAGEPRRIDPATGIALAGLVLSIPGAILAAVDLADRIKNAKRPTVLSSGFGKSGKARRSFRFISKSARHFYPWIKSTAPNYWTRCPIRRAIHSFDYQVHDRGSKQMPKIDEVQQTTNRAWPLSRLGSWHQCLSIGFLKGTIP